MADQRISELQSSTPQDADNFAIERGAVTNWKVSFQALRTWLETYFLTPTAGDGAYARLDSENTFTKAQRVDGTTDAEALISVEETTRADDATLSAWGGGSELSLRATNAGVTAGQWHVLHQTQAQLQLERWDATNGTVEASDIIEIDGAGAIQLSSPAGGFVSGGTLNAKGLYINGASVALQSALDAHTGDAGIHFTEASINHANIQNIGTNTHAQIDTHIASTANPHSVTAAQVGAIPDTLTVDGDLLTRSSSAYARVPIGAEGQKLVVSSGGLPAWVDDAAPQGWPYRFSTNTSAPPNSGQLRLNTSAWSTVTTIYADDEDNSGLNIRNFLLNLGDGSRIAVRDNADPTKSAQYTVNGTPTGAAGYVSIPVTYVSEQSATLPSNNAAISLVTQGSSGGGGGASPLTTKGDLFTYDTADARLAVGLDGQQLLADSSEPTGLRWGTPAGGGNVSDGDTLSIGLTFPNTGLQILDTAGNNTLRIVPGENLPVDTLLTINMSSESRTLTMVGDATLSGSNTGDQTINLTGDVTGSGTGTFATTIANDAVTYAKMQNVSATDRILGRATAGAGNVEEIICTAFARTILDDANAAAVRTTLDVPATGDVPTTAVFNSHHTYAIAGTISNGDALPFYVQADGAETAELVSATYSLGAGTCTVAATIAGTPVTGLNALAVTTTPAASNAAAPQAPGPLDKVGITISSASAASDLSVTLHFRHTVTLS